MLRGLLGLITGRALTIYLLYPIAVAAAPLVVARLGLGTDARTLILATVGLTVLGVLPFGWVEDLAARRPLGVYPRYRRKKRKAKVVRHAGRAAGTPVLALPEPIPGPQQAGPRQPVLQGAGPPRCRPPARTARSGDGPGHPRAAPIPQQVGPGARPPAGPPPHAGPRPQPRGRPHTGPHHPGLPHSGPQPACRTPGRIRGPSTPARRPSCRTRGPAPRTAAAAAPGPHPATAAPGPPHAARTADRPAPRSIRRAPEAPAALRPARGPASARAERRAAARQPHPARSTRSRTRRHHPSHRHQPPPPAQRSGRPR